MKAKKQEMKKRCPKCGEKKSLDEFRRNKTKKDGRSSRCKICLNAQKKADRAKDPEKYRAKDRARRARYSKNNYAHAKAKTKRCTKCGEEKPLDKFHKDCGSKDGRTARCKICNNAQRKADRAKDPEKIKAQRKARYAKKPKNHRARYAKDPGKYRARARKAYYKIKGTITKYRLMKAANIIKNIFKKGTEDENKKVK